VAEESSELENTLTGSHCRCAKHPVQTLSRVYCKDCSSRSAPKADLSSREPETSIVYSRERGRRTGEAAGFRETSSEHKSVFL